jgi:hypothetical protein
MNCNRGRGIFQEISTVAASKQYKPSSSSLLRLVRGEQHNFDDHSLSKLSLLVGNKLTGNPQFIACPLLRAHS